MRTDRQTDRHTPMSAMTTRPCGLRRAGNEDISKNIMGFFFTAEHGTVSELFGLPNCLRDVNIAIKDHRTQEVIN